jgi:hypothetical protein
MGSGYDIMVISSGEKPLTELIRRLVREELKRKETTGSGGNTLISSEKDLHLVTRGTHKAYYNGVEIGTGGGGAVTSVFGRTGAITAVNTDYDDYYLLLTGGTLTGNLYINKAQPSINLQVAGVAKSWLFWDTDTILDSYAGNLIYNVPTGSNHIFKENSVAVFQFGAAGATFTQPTSVAIYLNTDATRASLIAGASYVDLLASTGSLRLTAQTSGKSIIFDTLSGTRLTIANAVITADVPLSMNSHQITELTAGDTSHHAIRYDQVVGVYLPLTGGTLTNDLIIKDATPFLYFTSDADAALGSIGSTGAGLYLKNDVDSGSIYIQTGSGAGTTRIQVYDTGVALGVPLVMGSNAITTSSTVDGVDVSTIPSTYLALAGGAMTGDVSFTDGTGIDLRNDNIHKISYASGSNSMDISSYTIINLRTTVDSNTPLSAASDGVRLGEALFFRKNQASDTVYITDDASANMEFHVGTGKVFEFIVD